MGRINIEIPEDLHQDLRVASARQDTPIRELVINAVKSEYDAEQSSDQQSDPQQ